VPGMDCRVVPLTVQSMNILKILLQIPAQEAGNLLNYLMILGRAIDTPMTNPAMKETSMRITTTSTAIGSPLWQRFYSFASLCRDAFLALFYKESYTAKPLPVIPLYNARLLPGIYALSPQKRRAPEISYALSFTTVTPSPPSFGGADAYDFTRG